MQNYTQYIADVSDDINACLENMGCQPILFIGSGLSKRYFDGPNWEQLLMKMAELCPLIDKEYAYYKQSNGSNIKIGEVFSQLYKEWAWSTGKENFPRELFDASKSSDIYFKHKVREFIESITPPTLQHITESKLINEIELLQRIRPHTVITTNYDQFLEKVFPDYEPIIGQKILKTNPMSIGEVFKIHGCITEPESMVLTQNDYNEFMNKKKYLSAKLLTYFAEHPLLFIGYSAEDPNIKTILSDIDEIISSNNELIPNIYILEWSPSVSDSQYPQREKIISIDSYRSVRIKSITSNSFNWVFEAFGANDSIEKINPKILRSLLARTYELVRYDIPKRTIEVDFEFLEKAVGEEGELAKIYGITTLTNPTALNASFPYTLSQVSKQLGFEGWYSAHSLLEKVKRETGHSIKTSDNRYHITVKVGDRMTTHKYSEEMVALLRKVMNNEEYVVNL
ncbi:SIR2 family protein [Cohnella cellulosilytica]|uniref:SIR2 family protein n=1 Tax=Cohnella cellulosilytica TaxID=986710 RepID=A0ABW2FKY9_9BACL